MDSLRWPDGGFAFIGTQQWEAIRQALSHRLRLDNASLSDYEAYRLLKQKRIVLSGSSLGSSGTIGLLESKPDWADVVALGLAEPTDMALHRDLGMEDIDGAMHLVRHGLFMKNYLQHGNEHFSEYTAVNPYNNWSALGPTHNAFLNAASRPEAHIGKTIGVLARGNAAQRTVRAINKRDLIDQLHIKMRSGHEDKLCPPAALAASAVILGQVAEVDQSAHLGHYHPYLENLPNAQHEFRGFTH